MKAFIVLIFVAITHAGAAQYAPDVAVSTQHRTQDVWGNYNFGYDEKHATGGSWRKESSDASGNTVGSYGLYDADGRVRIVNYIADKFGFRAMVATNEHGTAASSPAGVGINAPMGPIGLHIDDEDNGGAENAFEAVEPVAVFAPAPVASPVSKLSPVSSFKRLPQPSG
ncbi:cuticle protein 14 [Rhipicephalus microplus]|uniref:cuticle protein 14 n=1 Tax=Rhipicephalus microplus TaxID=6941 RepID=UPI0023765292